MAEKGIFLLIVISMLVVILLAVGFIVLYNVFQSRLLRDAKLAYEKELDYKNSLLANTIEVQERERKRIAKDLHDDIGSKLSIVNLNINLLKDSVESNEQLEVILDHIESSLELSIEQTRSISHDLYPPILEKFGIQSAIESLAREITRTGVIKVNLLIDNEWKQFNKSEELHLYRIFQELTHNTIKHANASEIMISSKMEDGKLELEYKDNGKGISANGKVTGLGMSSIETRINILKGEMEVDTERARGFSVKFIL